MLRRVRSHDRSRGARAWSIAAVAAIAVAVWLANDKHGARGRALDRSAQGSAAVESATGTALSAASTAADGAVSADALSTERSGAAPLRVTTSLAEPTPEPLLCFVRVASMEGSLLADAVVRSSFDASPSERERSRAVTDMRGEASVSRPPDGVSWRLHVDADGHFHHRATRVTGDDVLIRLARATELSGVTIDSETGAPLAGVEVAHVHERCAGCDPERVRSDADGRFVLQRVPLGVDLLLTAGYAGYGDASVRLHVLPEDDTRACRIALRRSTPFRLAVVDALSGAAVASAEALPSGARARRDGVIALDGAPDGDGCVRVAVRAPGYLVSERRVAVTNGAPIPVPLLEGARIRGTLRRPDGSAIEGATVTAVEDTIALAAQEVDVAARASELPPEFEPRVDEGATVATTDADGRFELRGLWPRWRYVLRVTRVGGVPLERRDIATSLPGRAAVVALIATDVALGSWEGRALSNGAPIDAELQWDGSGAQGSARTGKGGAFALTGLPAGRVSLWARAARRGPGEPRAVGWESELVPSGGVLRRDVELSVDAVPSLVTRGFVVTPSGQGHGGVEVRVDAGVDPIVTFTDERGAFALATPGHHTGRRLFRARAHGLEASATDVRLGSEGTTIVLPRCVATAVHVVEAGTGRALERWKLHVSAAHLKATELGRTGDSQLDPAEALSGGSVVYLPEGRVQLEVSVPGLSLGVRREWTVTAGQLSHLTFVVPAFDAVEVRLEAHGDLPDRARVYVVPSDRVDEVGANLRARRWVPPIEVPVDGRLRSAREDGGSALESVESARIAGGDVLRVGLRREVDYVLIVDDPRVTVEPALIPSLGRAPGSRSMHTVRAAD